MSDGWKVALVFIGVIGAAAIIYQLNQGTLAQTGASTFTSAIGTAFSSSTRSTGNQSAVLTNKTVHSKNYSNYV